jgi:hypothetical protein
LSFIQLLNEIICCPIMNKKDVNMMWAWHSFPRKDVYLMRMTSKSWMNFFVCGKIPCLLDVKKCEE